MEVAPRGTAWVRAVEVVALLDAQGIVLPETPSSKPLPEKPSVAQLVYKFYTISEARRVITAPKRALQVLPLLVQMNPVQPLPHYF